MSDDATIAASTLVSSLLASAQSQPITQDSIAPATALGALKQNPDAFGDVLSENYDAAIDIYSAADLSTAPSGQLSYEPSSELSNTATLTATFNRSDAHANVTAEAETLPLLFGGNILPEPGEPLPLPTNDPLSHSSASNADFLKSDVGHKLPPLGNGAEHTTDTTVDQAPQELAHLDISGQLAEQTETDGLPTAGTAQTSAPGLAAGPVVATTEVSAARANEMSAVANGSANAVHQETLLDAQQNAGGDQGQSHANSKGNPDQAEPGDGKLLNVAEFSQNNEKMDELLANAARLVTRPGEITSPVQSPVNSALQLMGTQATTSIASLPLSADKGVAGAQIAQTLSGFIRHGDDRAEINLTPPNLGKISVRIALQNEQVNLVVSSPMPEIREAIEASLPRLGELLSEAGLSLGDTSVANDNSFEQYDHTFDNHSFDGAGPDSASIDQPTSLSGTQNYLIDAYA